MQISLIVDNFKNKNDIHRKYLSSYRVISKYFKRLDIKIFLNLLV